MVLFFRPKLSLLLLFLAATGYGQLHQWLISDQGMPATDLINKATIEGHIVSIPIQTSSRSQFQFLAERLDGKVVNANLLMSCYNHCPKVHAGEYWRFQAKLKKPINLANPGGFDYVGWLGSRHLGWVGNIRRNTFQPIPPPLKQYSLLQLREHLASILGELISDNETLGIFEALTLGLTNHIDKAQWDLFRRTGTTHLIDISGEHIALVAGLSYWLLKWVWKCLGSICLRYPAPKVASIGAIIISTAYALIAGFAVPTQRALITCCFMLLRNFLSQKITAWQSWRYALLLVLLFEPHSVFMLGFYFSFIAVAILILINQRIKVHGVRQMFSMQLACLFGLMPLSLYWFSYGSVNGMLANLLAIPLFGFVIVPLALLIAFLSPWFVIPGSIALFHYLIAAFLYCLRMIDSFEMLNINFTYTEALSPLILMAAMAIFTFLPLYGLFPATSLLVLASCFPNYEKTQMGDVVMDVLDVGQGLAIVIRTAHHVMIYDTGMKFFQGNDMGKLAIIPYLNTLGIKRIDKIVISHPDLDHRGGLNSLIEKYPVGELLFDDPAFYGRGISCHIYTEWQWDGVTFRFFPINKQQHGRNNRSCVLQIANDAGKILLSGDIEKSAEEYLITTYGQKLQSTIMLIPHHASKTSSSSAFIQQVAPRYAIASYGFDNRYHFPHQQTLLNYEKEDIPIYNTKDCGMVRVELKKNGITPKCHR